MTIYVILECAQTYEGANGYEEAFYPNRFLTLAKSEEEARAFIDFYSEDQKSFRMAMGTYICTSKENPSDLYPNGAICVKSGDIDILYYYKIRHLRRQL